VRQAFGRLQLSDTVFIALIPVFTYVVLFVFQVGYTSYFRVPSQFISFKLSDILTASTILVVFVSTAVTVAVMVIELLWRFGFRSWRKLGLLVLLVSAFILLLGLLIAIISIGLSYLLFALLGLAIIILAFFFERRRRERGFSDEQKFLGLSLRSITTRILFFGFVSLLLFIVLFGLGFQAASRSTTYRVVDTSPEMVVLFLTEERAIVSPFDRSTRTIEPAFTVLNFDDLSGVMFRTERLGKLTVASDILPP
jgi:hypothetical protein